MLTVGVFDDIGYDVNYSEQTLYNTKWNSFSLFLPAGGSLSSAIAGMDIRAEKL